ncbi:Phospholipase D/nuclease [Glarea lozoyensis ATCC 20868]|uniref:Phospholipase D/nuclease n=1 Tax=Glarea lozoyensis (strain ATCC 20868 / MF5171) TaxID=1116229 RepID=S3D3L7_GLAL2|nr:Phospholipase D/nuclease [Glarea lozoyensis ATCC 20868]EPE33077.1 Phospholipase D/nuclease [Glarea lozoyensis ATCC 20868]
MEDFDQDGPRKRRRLSDDGQIESSPTVRTLERPVSPPPLRRALKTRKDVPSPFQLTRIHDLPESSNLSTVSLRDILGDPMIAECWEFNYLHDLDFLMDAFDPDVKDLVKVNVVHGFWKSENPSRQRLKLQAEKYANVKLHTAYMPEMFGTHHSKMIIVIRHDDMAQVIIHTANMIEFDWKNMTQAVWRSPLLPKASSGSLTNATMLNLEMGSGQKFKQDLLNYLRAYDTRRTICGSLVQELSKYDFSQVHGALIASVPGRHGNDMNSGTLWGWPALKQALTAVSVNEGSGEIVVQISSIATLGPTDKWLNMFFKALQASKKKEINDIKFSIIFPTAEEIRRSLNGYGSGSAIHTKTQSDAQVKQLRYLRPILSHWAGDVNSSYQESSALNDAGRRRAAPHIKTYIRFGDSQCSSIDWMLVTSANLSKQAWGEAMNVGGDVRICSYEIGVLVWPELYGDGAVMIPTFKTDLPGSVKSDAAVVVGARMPYDIPLQPYSKDDIPWCATATYTEQDWKGETWGND